MRAADYTQDLRRLAELAADPASLDDLLGSALRALCKVVPYDLAAVYELSGEQLVVRACDGPLAGASIRTHQLSLAAFPTIRAALAARRPFPLGAAHHESAEGDPYDGVLDLPPGHACMIVPLYVGPRDLGLITLDRTRCETYDDDAVEWAGIVGQIVSMAMAYAEQSTLLERYRHRLREEHRLLREELRGEDDAVRLVRAAASPAMRQLVRLVEQVARTAAPVLLTGETGSGKEIVAQAIHALSPRADEVFVKLNCAALPDTLVESELFGYVRGAFSGAAGGRAGRFLTANGGTIFLDEIGDMPLALQGKLLRVLQEGTFEPVGSDRTARVDVRVLAATNVDLERAVAEHRFREDLYFRLAVFPLRVPPLRERASDLPDLIRALLGEIGRRRRLGPWTLSPAAEAALVARPWPGNVRELINVLERVAILVPRGTIDVDDLGLSEPATHEPATGQPATAPLLPFVDQERLYLERVLAHTRGRIYGAGGAAQLLGLRPTTLQSKLRKHRLR